MIPLESQLTGETFSFNEIEQQLAPLGFILASNWDYDHGYLDYQLADHVGYQTLRLPFSVREGFLDDREGPSLVEMGEPFLLSHKYQPGLDDNVKSGNLKAAFNQFSEPVDKDASFPEEYIPIGQDALQKAEQVLLAKRG
ncbi:YugN-like family protein [Thalassobacillus sp. CUG 92003]|uniref:YugN-like family protein n=1 Tax=Thalassobacillus sp. CUG 92003 TaxID=2736641 RepID=UPI0015E6AB8B|nr:YugN-like family protein [Thalassobacillus sp. CUG 92003]